MTEQSVAELIVESRNHQCVEEVWPCLTERLTRSLESLSARVTQAETTEDDFHDALIDELHGANLISVRIPDEGPDEEWVDESPSADLLMLAERAFRAALTGEAT